MLFDSPLSYRHEIFGRIGPNDLVLTIDLSFHPEHPNMFHLLPISRLINDCLISVNIFRDIDIDTWPSCPLEAKESRRQTV